MPELQFDYSCLIDVPPAAIYEYLSEPNNYRGLQPLVVAVRDVVYGEDQEGRQTRTYVAVERFRFLGFLRYDNAIRVLITLAHPDEVLINDVESPFNVRGRFVTTFQPRDGSTQVVETVTIKTPRLVQRFVLDQAKAAQHARFMNLKALLEAAHTGA